MKLVKFKEHFGSYNASEVASFEDKEADLLVAKGKATLVEQSKPEAPAPAADPAKPTPAPDKPKAAKPAAS